MPIPAPSEPPSLADGRRWALGVSCGLWLFAAWQLYLLPPNLSVLKRFGIPTPAWVNAIRDIPAWAPILVGAVLAAVLAVRQGRTLRTGVVAAALFVALAAHWGVVSMQAALHKAVHRPAVAVK